MSTEMEVDPAWIGDEGEKPMSEITLSEFEEFCATIAKQRDVCDRLKADLKTENTRLETLEQQAITALTAMNRKNYASKVGTITRVCKRSWVLPKTPEAKAAFFAHLRTEGIFDSMATVHSATMNSWVNEQFERATAEGRSAEFSIPGLTEPTTYETLQLRRG